MTQTFTAATVDVNPEGYLLDASQWSLDLAHEMAAAHGLTLTDRHVEVLQYLREKHAEGTPLTIRRIGKSGVVDIKTFYALFPGGPLKVSSKCAGIPKPTSCV
ncbi:TusE/DsrC/DsvC family sulfur relay protein [Rubrivirga sp. IMCC43871]|uniref:TusE/DsrC/DsvC family sulfur relay protein n=1 Tax=Rubrivirga sp. IMCC43871 TaxID=3391575 RepID=UPI00398FF702